MQQTLEDLKGTEPGTFANGVDAYIYGYPMLMFGVTGRTATTTPNDHTRLGAAPLNVFGKEPELPDYTFQAVVLPSTTTLYASSFLNLQAEPVILHIPDMQGRFFIMQMLDAWTEVSPQSPSPRLNSQPGDYALVGPDFTGTLPSGFEAVIRIPTNSMWIIGRIYTTGTDADVDDVKTNIYPGLTLTPLSLWEQHIGYQLPDPLPLEPMVDFLTPPLSQVAAMNACAFYGAMSAMMQYNYPISVQDDAIVEKLTAIGFEKQEDSPAYKPYNCTPDNSQLPTLQLAVAAARELLSKAPTPLPTKTFWTMATSGVGQYGNNYLLRAQVAQRALGANNPQDAVYGYTQKDGRNRWLDGTQNYQIHFAPPGNNEGIPPVNGFWSITIYDKAGKLVKNQDAIDHNVLYNAIGGKMVQGHSACFNSDGSLDLYLQPTAPSGGTPFCNWLPTTGNNEPFIVFLRMYWPSDVILNGNWIPPRIVRTNEENLV
jgi:hypothetical protein